MTDFDPNNLKEPEYSYATFVESRYPNFKYHSNIGHAKNAFQHNHNNGSSILYEKKEDKWVEIARIENVWDAQFCQNCGTAYETPRYHNRYVKWYDLTPKVVCWGCKRA